jgi:hypothetical protein
MVIRRMFLRASCFLWPRLLNNLSRIENGVVAIVRHGKGSPQRPPAISNIGDVSA